MYIYFFTVVLLAYTQFSCTMQQRDELLYASIVSVQKTTPRNRMICYEAQTEKPAGIISATRYTKNNGGPLLSCIFIHDTHTPTMENLPDIFFYKLQALHLALLSIQKDSDKETTILKLPLEQLRDPDIQDEWIPHKRERSRARSKTL